jgi:PQQ-dependent dehydrogenase (methanol/ethanol family)
LKKNTMTYPGRRVGIGLGALALLAACAQLNAAPPSAWVTAERIAQTDSHPQDWLSHGRGYDETRHSPLDEIDKRNVGTLGLAWFVDLDTHRGQESTPLVVDGVMYLTTAWSKVLALNAQNGRLLWRFDPKVPGATAVKACCDVVNRGAAAWRGKIFVGTLDGRLIALDARSGKPVWSVVTTDQSKPYTTTGAPRVVKGNVLIGNGGAEMGVRGYVSAYDAETGTLKWRFYTVPNPQGRPDGAASDRIFAERGNATWSDGDWKTKGGGGTVWDSMAYDPESDLLFIGVGNGAPWNYSLRSGGRGDNLFLSSIVALKPDTGEYVWHYQTTPQEQWDYTATQHMILADLKIAGHVTKVLMQAPKNGFFYVLDRVTGQLLSAKPYVPVNWATGVDMASGRPVVNTDAYYSQTGKPWLALPGPLGGHNWQPMAFNPHTRLVYIPAQEIPFPYVNQPGFHYESLAVNMGIDLTAASLPQDAAIKKQVLAGLRGRIVAWDPVAGREVWHVEHAGPWNGGLLSTGGGLLFEGTASGELAAYDAADGRQLWSFAAQTGITAPPISYAVDGVQYISVVAGWGGVFPLLAGELSEKSGKVPNRSRVLTFALNRKTELPRLVESGFVPTKPPLPIAGADTNAGFRSYQRFCSGCHGDAAHSGGVLPDLRWSGAIADAGPFYTIVGEGARESAGMVGFAANLNRQEIEAIRTYLIARANQDYIDSAATEGSRR